MKWEQPEEDFTCSQSLSQMSTFTNKTMIFAKRMIHYQLRSVIHMVLVVIRHMPANTGLTVFCIAFVGMFFESLIQDSSILYGTAASLQQAALL